MFAVIKTGGKQYRVKEGDLLDVEKLGIDAGKKITFDEVLLIEDGDNILIGMPLVEEAVVTGIIEDNFKGDNIIVFKKKRRKQYQKKRGHRQELTKVKIESISIGTKKAEKEKAEVKKEPEKGVMKEAEKPAKPEKKAKPESTAKKPAEKKTTTRKPAQKSKPQAKKKTEDKAAKKAEKTPAKKSTAKPKAESKTQTKTKPKTAEKKKSTSKKPAAKTKKTREGKGKGE